MQDAVPEDFVNSRGCRLSEHKQQVLERQDDGADQKGTDRVAPSRKRRTPYTYIPPDRSKRLSP